MEISFRKVHPWAIVPAKRKIDPAPKAEEARLLEEHFLYARASRAPEFCWPWRAAQELGWVIHSPITVQMDALNDFEAVCPESPEAMRQVANLAGATENWAFRDANGNLERMHFTRRAGWTAFYDFRGTDGVSQRMFAINGQGTLEWTLGWDVTIPPNYSILLMPYDHACNPEVLVGLLTGAQLAKRTGRTNGVSIGIRPRGPVTVERGQPIARVVVLHADSLRARAATDEAPGTQAEV